MSVLATMLAVFLQPATLAECSSQGVLSLHDPGILPMLLYFHTDECTGCASFDKLFDEPEILRRIEEHYVAVRINIDDLDGRACAEIYRVTNAPALVVAHHNGEVLFKSDANLTEADIRLLLEELPGRIASIVVSTSGDDAIANERVKPVPAIQIESIESDYNIHVLTTDVILIRESIPALNSIPVMQTNITSASTALPEVSASLTPRIGRAHIEAESIREAIDENENSGTALVVPEQRWTYAIQLGFFSDDQNARAYHHKAGRAGIKEIRTVEEQRKGTTFYRILTGECLTLEDAQRLLDEVHDLGFKGAVYRY